MISNTNKINPNGAIGRIGITPIAAKNIHTFLWTISIFNENKSSNNKIADASVTKENNSASGLSETESRLLSTKIMDVGA
ncbi:hypothetical protein SAMN05720467_2912 [Fibrobacter sp. UWB7]|nr:hypothetical protein SAMN05720467_2912 [Fibrobacter sp. UWB7]